MANRGSWHVGIGPAQPPPSVWLFDHLRLLSDRSGLASEQGDLVRPVRLVYPQDGWNRRQRLAITKVRGSELSPPCSAQIWFLGQPAHGRPMPNEPIVKEGK